MSWWRRSSAMVSSPAAPRPRRFISWTVKITSDFAGRMLISAGIGALAVRPG